MAKTISGSLRKKIEMTIYQTMDLLDKTKTNSEHYKEVFSKMKDDQFTRYISQNFPYRFYSKPFEIEPSMVEIKKALDFLGVPLLEKVHLPYYYEDEKGNSVTTHECLVCYIPIKKVKQFLTKKNSMSVDISQRDMKTGLLTGHDKNGKTSDREMESLAIMGLDKTMNEFKGPKADAMNAKNTMYNLINTKGQVSQSEIPIDKDDYLSKNLLNTYMVGALLNSNLVNEDYMLPHTLKDKRKPIARV